MLFRSGIKRLNEEREKLAFIIQRFLFSFEYYGLLVNITECAGIIDTQDLFTARKITDPSFFECLDRKSVV